MAAWYPHLVRPLLIGEAPGRASRRPFEGRCEAQLAALAGVTVPALRAAVVMRNLLGAWPGAAAKGALFPLPAARARAAVLRLGARDRVVILAGKRVARAFGVQAPYLARVALRGRTAYVLPHPSGVNRWYNSARNRARASRFLRGVLELDARDG